MKFVVCTIFLWVFPILAQDPWHMYLCNRFAIPAGDKSCAMEKHPLHTPGLEPSLSDWSEAVADHLRALSYTGKHDIVQRRTAFLGKPYFLHCPDEQNSSDYQVFSMGQKKFKPIVSQIMEMTSEIEKFKHVTGINTVVPAQNGPEISVEGIFKYEFKCSNKNSIEEDTPQISAYYYPVGPSYYSGEDVPELIGDTLEITEVVRPLPMERKEFNLKIDVNWDIWSCCSSCCCSGSFCGPGYSISDKKCESLRSDQSRMGIVSFMKINKKQPVLLEKFFMNHRGTLTEQDVRNALKEFEILLSNEKNPAIPIFSRVFNNGQLPQLEKILNQIFKYRFEPKNFDEILPSSIQPFGRFGKVVDSRTCEPNNPQKRECTELTRCNELWKNGVEYFTTTTTTFSPKTDNSWIESCRTVDFTDLVIDDPDESFSVKIGLNYRLRLDESIVDTTDKVTWQLGTNDIPSYDWSKSCSEQDVVVTPDNRSVIVVGFTKEVQHNVIGASISSRNTSKVYLAKFTVEFVSLPSKHDVKIFKWAAIIGGILICLMALVGFQIYYEIRQKRKLIMEMDQDCADTKLSIIFLELNLTILQELEEGQENNDEGKEKNKETQNTEGSSKPSEVPSSTPTAAPLLTALSNSNIPVKAT